MFIVKWLDVDDYMIVLIVKPLDVGSWFDPGPPRAAVFSVFRSGGKNGLNV